MLWQPTLASDLVQLRPLRESDWPALLAAASDPLVWEVHPEPTRHRPEVFSKFFAGGLESQGALVVEDTRTGAVIGSSRYTSHREDTSSVEIGYTFLERAYWGGEYNRHVKALMLRHAFTLVDSVYFVVGEHNVRSRRAMGKIGGVLVPAEAAPIADPTGHVVFRIAREDWRDPLA